jgi:hypothetical protein
MDSLHLCTIHWRHPSLCSPIGVNKDRYHCMLAALKEMVSTCLKHHKECSSPRKGQVQSIIPKRLIHVGSTDPPQPARLIKPTDLEELAAPPGSDRLPGYATLSYCWGPKPDPSCLTYQDNEEEFMQKLCTLPKTIEEAMSICRGMGVQYLWVDALCIMQKRNDRSEEWDTEASNVGQYYSNSIFTIAAGWATHNDEGCLPQKSAKLDSVFGGGSFGSLAYMAIDQSPLRNRAWVLQEASLSTRTLWFTNTVPFFLCKMESRDCRGRLAHITFGSRTGPQSPDVRRQHFEPLRQEPARYFDWYGVVEQYSNMQITNERDRMTAIQGMVQYVKAEYGDTWFAGIWTNRFPQVLLWRSVRTDMGDEKIRDYQHVNWDTAFCRDREKCARDSHNKRLFGLPSWSWASVNTPVRYNFIRSFNMEFGCQKEDCKIKGLKWKKGGVEQLDEEERDDRAGGHSLYAYLRLEAAVAKLKFEPDGWTSRKITRSCRVEGFPTVLELDHCNYWSRAERDGSLTAECALVMHICKARNPSQWGSMYLLLLEPHPEKSLERPYSRIGVAFITAIFSVMGVVNYVKMGKFCDLLNSQFGEEARGMITLL